MYDLWVVLLLYSVSGNRADCRRTAHWLCLTRHTPAPLKFTAIFYWHQDDQICSDHCSQFEITPWRRTQWRFPKSWIV